MCMKSEECKLAERVESLDERVDGIDQRVTRIESNMTSGFNTVTAAVNQLAADFGTRMNTLDQRIVEEKAKWGDTLRKIVLWSVATLLAGAAIAMGVTIWNTFSIK